MNSSVYSLTTWDSDGEGPLGRELIAGGFFTEAGTSAFDSPWIARWNPLASAGAGDWLPLASGTNYGLYALGQLDGDGPGRAPPRLLAGGWFTHAGARASPFLALFGRPDCLCPGDADGNLSINFADITNVLTHWGAEYLGSTGLGDTTGDGFVDFADIGEVLAHFNTSCE